MADLFQQLLSDYGEERLEVQYDTTFDRSELCFVLMVSFVHPLFEELPFSDIILLLLVLHEKKEGIVHDRAIQMMHRRFPKLNDHKNGYFVHPYTMYLYTMYIDRYTIIYIESRIATPFGNCIYVCLFRINRICPNTTWIILKLISTGWVDGLYLIASIG